MSAVSVNFTVQDNKGKTAMTKVHVPTGFTFAQYIAFGQAMGQLVANISEGALTEVSVSVPLNISGATLKAVALAIADVAEKAMFQAVSTVSGLFAKWFLPTYNEANTIDGSDQINTADPDVAGLITILEDGVNVSGTFITPRTVRGDPIDTVNVAREIFRKFS